MSDTYSVEEQLRGWLDQMADEHKLVLWSILTEDDQLQRFARFDYAVAQLRGICVDRGLDWDALDDNERAQVLDGLVRENERYATQNGRSSSPVIAPCHQCGHELTAGDLYRFYFGERRSQIERIERAAARLVVLDSEGQTEFPLETDSETIIGRIDPRRGIRPEIDLSRYDPTVRISRRHARIVARGNQFLIEDLGSSNGTIINGQKRLRPEETHQLTDGDVVKIGETTLKFV
ncbi:MAG TPA: FHA domain-containing protein, partial [Blastocatellia bacterium]|nr:FHA domain-containing protein [Blastocatellia bacterium]